MLWPVLVLDELGDDEAYRFARWQAEVVTETAGSATPQFIAECLDWRLAAWLASGAT
jgi:hypothetical protein